MDSEAPHCRLSASAQPPDQAPGTIEDAPGPKSGGGGQAPTTQDHGNDGGEDEGEEGEEDAPAA
jgi:hypothetical protein